MTANQQEIQLTPLSIEDLGQVTKLCAGALEYEEAFTAPFLAAQLFGNLAAPELLLAARRGERLAGFAAGRLLESSGSRRGFVRLLAVREEERRCGIATRLLDELERRLHAAGAVEIQSGGDAPGCLLSGVDLRYTAALCLFEHRGYARGEEPANMEINLRRLDLTGDALEVRLRRDGVVIRRLEVHHRDSFDRYLTRRWQPAWRTEALMAMDPERRLPPGFLALANGAIAGFAVYDSTRPGWFGPTGVNEELRGRGLGEALLRACLRDWQAEGRDRCEIAWIGPMAFYSRTVGARICRVLRQYRLASG